MKIAHQGSKSATASAAGMKPFSMSAMSTAIPAFLPRTRNTFVVPTLPDPSRRTSTP